MKKTNTTAILILAAGSSSRLGEAKQLVRYKNKTLLYHACLKALEISDDIFVVLGARYEECKEQIENLNVNIIKNINYNEGLSTSIKIGISKLQTYDKVLIMLCDQPLINSNHLKKILEKANETKKIVCSFYKNSVSVPAIFTNKVYNQLLSIKGDKGAKEVIKNNNHTSILLEDKFAFDIDTKNDLQILKKK